MLWPRWHQHSQCKMLISPCTPSVLYSFAQVNWETLWLPWQRRSLHEMLILPFILIFLLFPIGVFSGMPPSCNLRRRSLTAFLGKRLHLSVVTARNAGVPSLFAVLAVMQAALARSACSCWLHWHHTLDVLLNTQSCRHNCTVVNSLAEQGARGCLHRAAGDQAHAQRLRVMSCWLACCLLQCAQDASVPALKMRRSMSTCSPAQRHASVICRCVDGRVCCCVLGRPWRAGVHAQAPHAVVPPSASIPHPPVPESSLCCLARTPNSLTVLPARQQGRRCGSS